MSAAASIAAARARADEDLLRLCLEDALGGGVAQVADVRRERSAYASSYDAEIVTVRMASGEELKLFLKNFGTSGVPKDDAGRRRDRERAVYRELLVDAELGTPHYYASLWDEPRGRFWLLLEFVRGSELRSCELEYWIMAAAWLGRMHGHFAQLAATLRECDFLGRHDADYFRGKGERAARELRRLSRPFAARFERVMDRYERAVAIMARQRPTLVHGHFRPCNVLVTADAAPARICPVDWEQAAVGSGLYDLALLTDGFASPELDRLLDAYRGEATSNRLEVPEGGELRQLVDCFRLFLEVNLLSRSAERGFSERKVAEIVARLEERQRALESLRDDV